MHFTKVAIVLFLGFFQAIWIVCEEIQGEKSCPVQPLRNPFEEIGEELREIKANFIKVFPSEYLDRDLVNAFALVGMIVTISEVVLITYYLVAFPMAVLTGILYTVLEISLIIGVFFLIFKESIRENLKMQDFSYHMQTITDYLKDLNFGEFF